MRVVGTIMLTMIEREMIKGFHIDQEELE